TAARKLRRLDLIPEACLLRASCIPLRDRGDRKDPIPRARCAPRAVEKNRIERLLVRSSERNAMQHRRAGNAAEELALRRKYIHRLTGTRIDAAFRINRCTVSAHPAAQLGKLALIRE